MVSWVTRRGVQGRSKAGPKGPKHGLQPGPYNLQISKINPGFPCVENLEDLGLENLQAWSGSCRACRHKLYQIGLHSLISLAGRNLKITLFQHPDGNSACSCEPSALGQNTCLVLKDVGYHRVNADNDGDSINVFPNVRGEGSRNESIRTKVTRKVQGAVKSARL